MKKRVLLTVEGLVQGVNFRYHIRMTAESLGVSGWVMNLPDGRVQGLFEGDSTAVDQLLEWCRKGPPSSRVDTVTVSEKPFRGEFDGFIIRR